MNLVNIAEFVRKHERLKSVILFTAINPVRIRPRCWVRFFRFMYISRGRKSVICHSARKDLVPFNRFSIGERSIIEDFATLNNMVGGIEIGKRTRVGIGNVIIGPVKIGDNVIFAQNVVISGLDHNYIDVNLPILDQGVSTAEVIIEDEVWIGANSVVTKGTKIGKHSVIAASSLVNKDVPPFCLVGGNPARIIKKYSFESGRWERVLL
ncbi:MAG: acyltransferase [Rikenellaceae bacterium]